MLNNFSISGQLSFNNIEEFEFWCSKTPQQFKKLMSYPDARKYFDRKKEAARALRASKLRS